MSVRPLSSDINQDVTSYSCPVSKWEDTVAENRSEQELLLYRSNLLGRDLTVTNFGGGNTSAKVWEVDPLAGEDAEVLWVKGSGGDLGSMHLDGFATLYQSKLIQLEAIYRENCDGDKMVEYLPHCTFNLNARAASIDTPLHAFLPYKHVDHVHPDPVIALATAKDGEQVVTKLWKGKMGWLDWQRPGFDLGLKLRDYVNENPDLVGVMLAGHGVICWGDTSKSCYENTLGIISTAASYLNQHMKGKDVFGGKKSEALPGSERRKVAANLMPRLRGLVSQSVSKVGHFSDNNEVLEFVCSLDCERLAAIGTSCPDHFLRTKIKPLVLNDTRIDDDKYLEETIEKYRRDYADYYQRCASVGDPDIRDSNPVVILVPRVGCITFAGDKSTARIASEFYQNAINVMRGAEGIGGYVGLDEQEAFNIEYWSLEEAKLKRMPAPKPLNGKIVVVTGGAGGIGKASALKMLSEGACVFLLDRDEETAKKAKEQLVGFSSADHVAYTVCDVTDEQQISNAMETCTLQFGGMDILVANAGIASSAPLEETSVDLWRQNFDVLAQGYFLNARAAFPLLKQQGGGSIIFIGSKNGLAAAVNASAYASAKAASIHLARCLALEGAPFGIRVNTVNPDMVIRGSRIWDGEWRNQRANAHGIDSGEELEAHYRNRSLLKRDVLPEDVAGAVYFFASEASAKSTGNILNVDAGNAQAFTR